MADGLGFALEQWPESLQHVNHSTVGRKYQNRQRQHPPGGSQSKHTAVHHRTALQRRVPLLPRALRVAGRLSTSSWLRRQRRSVVVGDLFGFGSATGGEIGTGGYVTHVVGVSLFR